MKYAAGYISSKKEFKEKIMTKLYVGTRYVGPDQPNEREEVLSEIWAADKKLIDGHWYVKLSDVCEILGSNE